MGLDRDFVDDSTPKELEPYVEAHNIKRKERDADNWQLGIYFMRAIAVCFNFSNDKVEYFEKPIFEQIEYEQSEQYKIDQQEKLMAMLKTMQANFELNKGRK